MGRKRYFHKLLDKKLSLEGITLIHTQVKRDLSPKLKKICQTRSHAYLKV